MFRPRPAADHIERVLLHPLLPLVTRAHIRISTSYTFSTPHVALVRRCTLSSRFITLISLLRIAYLLTGYARTLQAMYYICTTQLLLELGLRLLLLLLYVLKHSLDGPVPLALYSIRKSNKWERGLSAQQAIGILACKPKLSMWIYNIVKFHHTLLSITYHSAFGSSSQAAKKLKKKGAPQFRLSCARSCVLRFLADWSINTFNIHLTIHWANATIIATNRNSNKMIRFSSSLHSKLSLFSYFLIKILTCL